MTYDFLVRIGNRDKYNIYYTEKLIESFLKDIDIIQILDEDILDIYLIKIGKVKSFKLVEKNESEFIYKVYAYIPFYIPNSILDSIELRIAIKKHITDNYINYEPKGLYFVNKYLEETINKSKDLLEMECGKCDSKVNFFEINEILKP